MHEAHGKFNITTTHDLLVLDATGPFNLQHVNNLIAEMARIIPQMDGDWGQLTIFHDDSIFVPEAFKVVKQSIKARGEHGLKCVAIVLVSAQCSFIMKQQITAIYENTSLPFAFFDSETLAKHWLADALQESTQH